MSRLIAKDIDSKKVAQVLVVPQPPLDDFALLGLAKSPTTPPMGNQLKTPLYNGSSDYAALLSSLPWPYHMVTIADRQIQKEQKMGKLLRYSLLI